MHRFWCDDGFGHPPTKKRNKGATIVLAFFSFYQLLTKLSPYPRGILDSLTNSSSHSAETIVRLHTEAFRQPGLSRLCMCKYCFRRPQHSIPIPSIHLDHA
ncbi:hypothetical protein M747DRAFT_49985 [Aspergillus niger ATCC 13496]|uniref:Uncharacterized protein n=1 Tax=Aspergillus niger ATCC 13496 TaxID=1353008 RepID=A0A370C2P8_ASPNG|nr:hypothetical protein M747DRAFT_49985 [Aspergillus niger ATCC 13496]